MKYTKIDLLSKWTEYKVTINQQQDKFKMLKTNVIESLQTLKCHIEGMTEEVEQEFKQEEIKNEESKKRIDNFEFWLESMAFD